MTCQREWLKDFDVGRRTTIKLANNNTLSAEGMRKYCDPLKKWKGSSY